MSISLETLQSLSIEDLIKLKDDLKKLEKSKEQEVVKRFITDMAAIGVSYDAIKDKKVSELLKTTTKSKKPAKYMNPNDDSQTWTGWGPMPKWLKELIASGNSKEDFAI
jgi:DNA-binding protein H-NS